MLITVQSFAAIGRRSSEILCLVKKNITTKTENMWTFLKHTHSSIFTIFVCSLNKKFLSSNHFSLFSLAFRFVFICSADAHSRPDGNELCYLPASPLPNVWGYGAVVFWGFRVRCGRVKLVSSNLGSILEVIAELRMPTHKGEGTWAKHSLTGLGRSLRQFYGVRCGSFLGFWGPVR